jgi:acetoin utilization deacetylase AcuC-like enzyme
MAVLIGYHDAFQDHDTGPHHPESPARLDAVLAGIDDVAELVELTRFSPEPASLQDLYAVHDEAFVDQLSRIASVGGDIDADTHVGPESWSAALRAAGAGIDAARRLRAGAGSAAFLALRPPGHHAMSARAMGFCLLNNVAVTAARLVAEGERVLIVDYDAHHGNGTEQIFYGSSEVFYVSFHQSPCYPGTGAANDIGAGNGLGTTLNVPFPMHTAGDAYRLALEEVVIPSVELFSPTWLLLSAGFDAHRADPLTNLGLSSGDFADLTMRLCRLVAPGRRVAFLEGGYDLQALRASVGACVAALGGTRFAPEPPTSGGAFGAGPDGAPVAVIETVRAARREFI